MTPSRGITLFKKKLKNKNQKSENLVRPAAYFYSDKKTGKSMILNKAIQDIGMGRYQWQLFVLCGMGWLADKSD